MRPWLAAALLLVGCSASHPAGRSDGGIPCGARTCRFDEQCCSICAGDTLCVSVDRMCPDVSCVGCSSDAECEPDEYCLFEEGACGGIGNCEFRPGDCLGESTFPVCACDGLTYDGACEARARGQSVETRRSCEAPPVFGCSETCIWLAICSDIVPPDTCIEDCRDATSDCSAADWARVRACLGMADCMLGISCASEIPCFSE